MIKKKKISFISTLFLKFNFHVYMISTCLFLISTLSKNNVPTYNLVRKIIVYTTDEKQFKDSANCFGTWVNSQGDGPLL